MTQEEQQQVKKVCGENYSYNDIPSYIRNRKPKDRFEAGMTKEQWEDLMERIYPVNK